MHKKHFLKFAPVAILLSLAVCTSVSSYAAPNRTDKNDINAEEISLVQSIADTKNPQEKRARIETESRKTSNPKLKEILTEKIAVDSVKSEIVTTSNIPNKYESNSKNYTCWDGTGSQQMRNAIWVPLYSFSMRVNACADTSTVYSGAVRATWGDIYTWGWSYYGESQDRKFDYVNSNKTEYIASRQGVFKLCVNSSWVCIYESRPWVEYHATRQGQNDYFF
jgi:hypothetical protein